MSLKLGLIGLDTSHVEIFTNLLNDPSAPYHDPGGKVVIGCPYPSPNMPLSAERVVGYTTLLRDTYHVAITDSPTETAKQADAILITSVDGNKHLELMEMRHLVWKTTFRR
ncbi:hypothetical protein [Thalassobacillus sp. CUG 92003]|uniref:hypothetical protein n=1 Tax=Thalassobacillus sp. CUG 92003 TaxID=2736641 RepID=UPI0015E6BEAA|nr:hypothetical protein [Thalassobacillus sp. CUG 92003]